MPWVYRFMVVGVCHGGWGGSYCGGSVVAKEVMVVVVVFLFWVFGRDLWLLWLVVWVIVVVVW